MFHLEAVIGNGLMVQMIHLSLLTQIQTHLLQ